MNADFRINGKVIESDRLILRAFEYCDLDDFFAYTCVDGVGEMAGWKHHENKEESLNILKSLIKSDKTFALVYKENNKVIGSLVVKKYGFEDKYTEFSNYYGRELGAVLSKDYRSKGLMSEAIKALIDYLFNELNLDFLTAGYFDFNKRSKKMQENLGFKPYRKVIIDTSMGTKEPGVLSLLVNPNKNLVLNFSHQETLIYQEK